MTYEEYKNSKKIGTSKKKNKFLILILSKLFTIVIFTMIVIIISNKSIKFRNFLIDDVLNKSMDFSKINNKVNKLTDIFKSKKVLATSSIKDDIQYEEYKDGIKYIQGNNKNVYLKNSGIVTYIGNKEGYGNTIVFEQSDGYFAWYGNVEENIKLYDYIESGEVIGTSEEEYYFVLFNGDLPIKYED